MTAFFVAMVGTTLPTPLYPSPTPIYAGRVVSGLSAALFASAVVCGLGQGIVICAGLAAIAERAPPAERRGETASGLFVLHLELSLLVIGAGVGVLRSGCS